MWVKLSNNMVASNKNQIKIWQIGIKLWNLKQIKILQKDQKQKLKTKRIKIEAEILKTKRVKL
jgi:hypothetical protein